MAWLQLTNLRELELQANNLSRLPRTFSQLTALEALDVSCNDLVEFDFDLSHFSSLRKLLLDANRLDWMPPELGTLSRLKTLNIAKNPWIDSLLSRDKSLGTAKMDFARMAEAQARQEIDDLWGVAIGLAHLRLPVLLVLQIANWCTFAPRFFLDVKDARIRWAVAKKVLDATSASERV